MYFNFCVTFPNLIAGIETIKRWGFTYKTLGFCWVKKNKISDSWFWELGFWTRANPEICLIGSKGHPKRVSKSVHSIIDSPIENHSKKPDEIRERIIELCGDLPKIELFARQTYEGWVCLANEIDGLGIRESIKKIKELDK